MEEVIKRPLGDVADYFYSVFRILIGLLFMQHGLQKIFGLFGGIDKAGNPVAEISSQAGLAGMIELAVGLAVILGIFVRLAALIGAIEMLVAYVTVHFPMGVNPVLNGGELAVLFFASFLVMIKEGNGRLSLENLISPKESF